MKKFLLLLFLSCISLVTHAQDGMFTITGNVKGLKEGTTVSLYKSTGRLQPFLDTKAENEHFFFEGEVSGVEKFVLLSMAEGIPNMMIFIYAAPGKHITITGEDLLIRTWRIESDIPEQQEVNRLNDIARDEYIELQKIRLQLMKLYRSEKQDQAEILSLQEDSQRINLRIYRKQLEVMKTSPIGEHTILILLGIAESIKHELGYEELKDEALTIYQKLTPKQQETNTGILIYENLHTPVLQPGEDMADGVLYDVDGNPHKLSDYSDKEKYILLDFWAHWCGPCLSSVPEMKAIHDEYEDKLTIIGISTDREKDREKWIQVSKEKEIGWVNLHDRMAARGIKNNYGVKGIPHYVLISPEGTILECWTGYQKGWIREKVEKYMKEKE